MVRRHRTLPLASLRARPPLGGTTTLGIMTAATNGNHTASATAETVVIVESATGITTAIGIAGGGRMTTPAITTRRLLTRPRAAGTMTGSRPPRRPIDGTMATSLQGRLIRRRAGTARDQDPVSGRAIILTVPLPSRRLRRSPKGLRPKSSLRLRSSASARSLLSGRQSKPPKKQPAARPRPHSVPEERLPHQPRAPHRLPVDQGQPVGSHSGPKARAITASFVGSL